MSNDTWLLLMDTIVLCIEYYGIPWLMLIIPNGIPIVIIAE